MAKVKKTIKILAYTLLTVLLIYNLTIIIKSVIVPNKTPSFLGIKTYVIVSGSMEPYLNIGDIVIVKEVDMEDLNVGDVISFRKDKNVITHRLKEIIETENEKMFKTGGDNNNVDDNELVEYRDIEGKVVKKISNLGNLQLFLLRKEVIIAFIVLYYIYIIFKKK